MSTEATGKRWYRVRVTVATKPAQTLAPLEDVLAEIRAALAYSGITYTIDEVEECAEVIKTDTRVYKVPPEFMDRYHRQAKGRS